MVKNEFYKTPHLLQPSELTFNVYKKIAAVLYIAIKLLYYYCHHLDV
jgi:hypothetical protein